MMKKQLLCLFFILKSLNAVAPALIKVSARDAYMSVFSDAKLYVFDLKSAVTPIASVTLPTNPISWYVNDSYIYVVGRTSPGSFRIIDVSNRNNPTIASTTAIGNMPMGVTVVGNYAYVTNRADNTMEILNVSNPSSPVSLGTISVGGSPISVASDGQYLLVTSRGANLVRVYSLTDPAAPTLVGAVTTASQPELLFASDKLANWAIITTAGGSPQLQTIDFRNPSAPRLENSIPLLADADSLVVQGKRAYVYHNAVVPPIEVFDFNNVSLVRTASTLSGTGVVAGFDVRGTVAYYTRAADLLASTTVVLRSQSMINTVPNIPRASIEGDISFSDNIFIGGSLIVANDVTVKDDLTVIGKLNISQNTLVIDDITGRVGIGTASPNAKLDVRGTVSVAGDIQYRPVSGLGMFALGAMQTGMRVCAGRVTISGNSAGSLVGSTGDVSVAFPGSRVARIQFQPPFSAAPFVFVTTEASTLLSAGIDATATANQVDIVIRNTLDLAQLGTFQFMAIGPA